MEANNNPENEALEEFQGHIRARIATILASPAMAGFNNDLMADILSQIRAYVTAGAEVIWNDDLPGNAEDIRVPHALEEQMDDLGLFIGGENQAGMMDRMEIAENVIQEMEEELQGGGGVALLLGFAQGIRMHVGQIIDTLFGMEVAEETIRDIVLRIRGFVTEDGHLDWEDEDGIIPRVIEDDVIAFRDYVDGFPFQGGEEERIEFINDRIQEIANEVVGIPGNVNNASTVAENAEEENNNAATVTSVTSNNSRRMNLMGGRRARRTRRRRLSHEVGEALSPSALRAEGGRTTRKSVGGRRVRRSRRRILGKCRTISKGRRVRKLV